MNIVKTSCTVGKSRGSPVKLYHELHGTGVQKVLFITGWAGSCDNWSFQTDFFRSLGPFQVCIFENRGSGYSSAPPNKYRMLDMAHDASELINHLGWTKVGVSMGGMIAQELMLLRPESISSLCLASTHAGLSLPPLKHLPWLSSTFGKMALGLAKVKDMMPKLLYSSNWLYHLKPTMKGRADSRPPVSTMTALAQLWGICRHYVSVSRLHQIQKLISLRSIPAMVIHGTEDCLVHASQALHLASNMGARLVYFDGRGHALNHEDVETFNRLLLCHFYTALKLPNPDILSGWTRFKQLVYQLPLPLLNGKVECISRVSTVST